MCYKLLKSPSDIFLWLQVWLSSAEVLRLPSPHHDETACPHLSTPSLPLQTTRVQVPINSGPSSPRQDSGTQVPSLRGMSGRAVELGNRGACLHPDPPPTHPGLLCSQRLSHKAVLCSTTVKLPTAEDLTFVLVFSCLP